MENKPFKILSIDGGGIRGLFPATYLANLEEQIQEEIGGDKKLSNYFDLICGTSTGGIIATAIALGMPTNELVDLYEKKADVIFGKKQAILGLRKSSYRNNNLEKLLKENFATLTKDGDTRLGHAKTRVCIPVFNAFHSKVNVLKTSHHKHLITDYQIPAYQVAVSTSSAPTYFDPYTIKYQVRPTNREVLNHHNIDGGIFANNPTLIGYLEALSLGVQSENIRILSLGTGLKKYSENHKKNGWGLKYWMWPSKKRLVDMIFQSQSEIIENCICMLKNGIGKEQEDSFYYERVQYEFKSDNGYIPLDCTKKEKLLELKSRANSAFKESGKRVFDAFCNEEIIPYEPFKKI